MTGGGAAEGPPEPGGTNAASLARGAPCDGVALQRMADAVMASAPAGTAVALLHADKTADFVARPKGRVRVNQAVGRTFILHVPPVAGRPGHWLLAVVDNKGVLQILDNQPPSDGKPRTVARRLGEALSKAPVSVATRLSRGDPCWRSVLSELAARANVNGVVFESNAATADWFAAGCPAIPSGAPPPAPRSAPTPAPGPTGPIARPVVAEAMDRERARRLGEEARRTLKKKQDDVGGGDREKYKKGLGEGFLILKEDDTITGCIIGRSDECPACHHKFDHPDEEARQRALRNHVSRQTSGCPLARAQLPAKKRQIVKMAGYSSALAKFLRVPMTEIPYVPLTLVEKAEKRDFLRRPLQAPQAGGEAHGAQPQATRSTNQPVHISELMVDAAERVAAVVSTRLEHLPVGCRNAITKEHRQKQHRALTDDLRGLYETAQTHEPGWMHEPLQRGMLLYAQWRAEKLGWAPPTYDGYIGTLMGALNRLSLYTRGVMSDATAKHDSSWSAAATAARKDAYAFHHSQAYQATKEEVQAVLTNPGVHLRLKTIIAITWLIAGRVGDVLQLQKKDVELVAGGRGLRVTYRRGKTVLITGPRTVDAEIPHASWEALISEHLGTVNGDLKFIFHAPSGEERKALRTEVNRALRTANDKLTCPSLRIGSLQTMFTAGVPVSRLREYSGHTTDQMCLRYLRYGRARAGLSVEATADAARLSALSRAERA